MRSFPGESNPSDVVSRPASDKQAEKPCRVLVVEDNQDSAETLRMLLEYFGYQVTLASSGPDALEAAKIARPNVVLCDTGLPGLDGFAVARALRQDAEAATARLIAVTGRGEEEDCQRALEAGFDSHLEKPADFAKLFALL